MKKKRHFTLGVLSLLILLLLTGCVPEASTPTPTAAATTAQPTAEPTPEPTLSPTPTPELTLDPTQEPPLLEIDLEIPVPEFLDAEQQTLYRRAYILYGMIFACTTENRYDYIDALNPYPNEPWRDFYVGETRYAYVRGRYRNWADFDAMVHNIFTDRWFQEWNTMPNGLPKYQEKDGRTCAITLIRFGYGARNEYFPDTFTLLEQTEDCIRFSLAGYYSHCGLLEGETSEECTARLKAGYEYTEEFEIVLVRQEDGWRFDAFYTTDLDGSNYKGTLE